MAAAENINPEEVWEMFYNSFKRFEYMRVFDHFFPHSYLVVRLPVSEKVRIYNTTTDDMRSCVHAERHLVEDLRRDLANRRQEDGTFHVTIYYSTYTTCVDCVRQLLSFAYDIEIHLEVKVVNITAPQHRHQLLLSYATWEAPDVPVPYLTLSSIWGQSDMQCLNNLATIFNLLRDFTIPNQVVPNLALVITERPLECDVDRFMTRVNGADVQNDEVNVEVTSRQLLYVAEQCRYFQQRLQSLLNGKDIVERRQVMDSFINSYIRTFHVADPLFEQVYQELSYIVVKLPHSRTWRVYNSVKPGEHVEQLFVRELREELKNMRGLLKNMPKGEYLLIEMYLNYLPCCRCLHSYIFPLLDDYSSIKLRIKEHKLTERLMCKAGNYCPFMYSPHGCQNVRHNKKNEPWNCGGVFDVCISLNHHIGRGYRIEIGPNEEFSNVRWADNCIWHLVNESQDCYGAMVHPADIFP